MMQLDDEDVRAILQLLDASPYDEWEVETDRFRLTLRREEGAWTREVRTLGTPREVARGGSDGGPVGRGASGDAAPAPAIPGHAGAPGPTDLAPMTAGAGLAAASAAAGADGPAGEFPENGSWPVATPLPGTFYRSPKPGAPPFVQVGVHVDADTVVGIVETMKLMNSVMAGRAGHVAEICVADAQAVAQRAVLMRIVPDPT